MNNWGKSHKILLELHHKCTYKYETLLCVNAYKHGYCVTVWGYVWQI